MAVTAPGIHNPSDGATIPTAWGDAVNADLNTLDGRHIVSVRKTSDQATTSTHTDLRDATSLVLAVASNEVRYFRFILRSFSGASTTGLKVAITVPTGATLVWEATVAVSTTYAAITFGVSGSGTEALTTDAPTSSTTPAVWFIDGLCVNGSTAGNIQLRFGAEANAVTTIQAGSRGYSWT